MASSVAWAWIAIALGSLIVLSRAPLVFWPEATLATYRRIQAGLLATDLRVRLLGGAYVALAGASFAGGFGAGADPHRAGVAAILLAVGALCVGAALWTLLAPRHFRSTIAGIVGEVEKTPGFARVLGLGAVVLGTWILVLGVRAL